MNLILLLTVIYVGLANAETYSTKFDDIDVDEILQSDRLLKNYVHCLMEHGPCTPEGNELKKYLPEALETDCMKCSDKQKENSKKILKFLYKNKLDYYREIQEKYDPNNDYYNRHKDMFS